MRCLLRIVFVLAILALTWTRSCADEVDDYIISQMAACKVAGLSLAIVDGGRIVKSKGYGLADRSSSDPVKQNTLFLAGSVSKSVAAVGALRLVESGKLDLNRDINDFLTTWKVPSNSFTAQHAVTLSEILSHTAGFNVHGFAGYAVGAPRPGLVQVLNGEAPANSAPIRVEYVPGSRWQYSGGGYTVMQMAMVDVTGMRFPEYMKEAVLTPLDMLQSTYQQPLAESKNGLPATGYYGNGSQVPGRWHIYPEMAAAGLWTTASDLARFAIGIQKAASGGPNALLSQQMVDRMLTPVKSSDGLGVFLEGRGQSLRFTHNGVDEGFDTLLVAYAHTGQGAVIMINDNESTGMSGRIMRIIGRAYHWPD